MAIGEIFARAREWNRRPSKGQTMTEYALITVAIAIMVFIAYEATGQDLSSLVNGINTDLSTSS
jgi:Flp pilus assembly pilin Flp